MKLLSFIIVFQLFVVPIHAKEVILGGDTIGIQIEFDGVLISSTYVVQTDEFDYDPLKSDILPKDLIKEVNHVPIKTIEELSFQLNKFVNQDVNLTIDRDGKIIERILHVHILNNQIRSGLFVKDEILGIGTLTYIDPADMSFASLGHEVLDSDTQMLIPLHDGTLFEANVTGMKKGNRFNPGEKLASINFSSKLGQITQNNMFGIYGTISHLDTIDTIETANQNECSLGHAYMYTVLSGNEVEPVLIDIAHIHHQHEKDTKSFEFKVIDEKCLFISNGIVQGMSGSPIVQNGKLIGAVTHVSASDSTYGYGIFIEWMLETNK